MPKNIFEKIIFFSENNFVENILQYKPFYVETNEALATHIVILGFLVEEHLSTILMGKYEGPK
jgi:hypothetical protein